jgi:acyl-homoserine lactone acylase PvdQ
MPANLQCGQRGWRYDYRLTFEQAGAIARDIGTHDSTADYLKSYILMAIEATKGATQDAHIKQAGDYLRSWDNHSTDGSVAKIIFDAWFQELREAIFADEFRYMDSLAASSGIRNFFISLTQPSLILHILDGTRSGVPPSRDYLNGRNKNEIIIEALKKALDNLGAKYGPQMNLWRYDQPEIYFKPLPGIPGTSRGTYIQIIEVSRPFFRGESILPPGQSEDISSPHYSDQRELAGYWRFKPMIYQRVRLL